MVFFVIPWATLQDPVSKTKVECQCGSGLESSLWRRQSSGRPWCRAVQANSSPNPTGNTQFKTGLKMWLKGIVSVSKDMTLNSNASATKINKKK
jgi:hypothetical protein